MNFYWLSVEYFVPRIIIDTMKVTVWLKRDKCSEFNTKQAIFI